MDAWNQDDTSVTTAFSLASGEKFYTFESSHISRAVSYFYHQFFLENEDAHEQIFLFSSLFMPKYKAGGYGAVRKWLKEDIFSKKYLLFPIHDSDAYVSKLSHGFNVILT